MAKKKEEVSQEQPQETPELVEIKAPEVNEKVERQFVMEDYKEINGFTLENDDKLQRVVFGETLRDGVLQGGLGEGAKPEDVLVAYDRKGGLITKDGVKVKNGAFFDSRTKKARPTPEPIYVYNVAGNFIEVSDPAELSGKILELNGINAEKQAEFAKKKAKSLENA